MMVKLTTVQAKSAVRKYAAENANVLEFWIIQ